VAALLGAIVAHEFVDNGAAGNTIDRLGLRAMLDYLIEPGADLVIVADHSRLARNMHLDYALAEQIVASGASISVVGHQGEEYLGSSR
jgi:DNA invertase Pin-like site-specific DNA recombinase